MTEAWLANLPPEARAHVESWGRDGVTDWAERVSIQLEDGHVSEGSAPWGAYVRECLRRIETQRGGQGRLFAA